MRSLGDIGHGVIEVEHGAFARLELGLLHGRHSLRLRPLDGDGRTGTENPSVGILRPYPGSQPLGILWAGLLYDALFVPTRFDQKPLPPMLHRRPHRDLVALAIELDM